MMKRIVMIAVLLVGMGLSTSLIGAAQIGEQESQDDSNLPITVWKRGLAISPVPLNLDGKSRKLVGTGSYLVNANSDCADCHTNPLYVPGGNPFQGQNVQVNVSHFLAGGRTFGPFKSRNLTPEPPSNLPAGLTFDQFVEVMRTGKDFDNLHPQISPLLQVMPWPIFSHMTDDDLRAIYEYLRAIPHAEP